MPSKRLNIMLYSDFTGEQIILPVNPNNIEIKYEKEVETYDILGFGEVNIMGNSKPVSIKLSHFLPEDNSIFGTNAGIVRQTGASNNFMEYDYSSDRAVEILRKWAFEKYKIRLVIDDEINMECIVISFMETIRESTASKPYVLEVVEYRNPSIKTKNNFGLIKRSKNITPPVNLLMKSTDTIYSVANKYGLDFKTLAKINNIKDVNGNIEGTTILIGGA